MNLRTMTPGVLLLLLAACGGGDSGSSTAAGGGFCGEAMAAVDRYMSTLPQPQGEEFGGTVVVASIGEIPDGMNALVSSDYTANQHQLFVNLMSLIQFDEALNPQPYLARSWEISEDGTELTFRLRDDIYWHDGVQTTAEDVAFTYLRATDPVTGFPNDAFWTNYVRGQEGVTVVDPFTVIIRLRPHAEFLDPWRATSIMPAHLLGDVPASELRQHPFGMRCPVGNGPFRFVEHRQDESWTFERNPGFPAELGGPPPVERYVYRVIPEPTTLLTELLTERIDVYIAPRPEQAPDILASPNTELLAYPFRSFVFVAWNSRRPQLADARVRRALTIGVNRQQIVEALRQGYGLIANSSVPPFHWAYYPEIADSLPYNPARAAALLDEAGWVDRDGDGIRENADGVPLRLTVKYNQGNEERRDIAEIMQAQLGEIGVAIQPQVVEWATMLSQVQSRERDFDGVVMGWVTEFRIDDTDLFASSRRDDAYAYSGTQNETLDRLMEELPLIVDREEALPKWREYQYELVAEQPYTFIYFQDRLDGVNTRLQNVTMDARGEWVNIREWSIDPARRGNSRAASN
jgi:peptide/nickel transport system substrate-binding protein